MLGQVVTTHHVKDQVDALPIGLVFDDLGEVLRFIKNRPVSTQFATNTRLVFRSDCCEDSAGPGHFAKPMAVVPMPLEPP